MITHGMRKRSADRTLGVAILSALLACLAWGLAYQIRAAAQTSAAASWPTAHATIVASGVREGCGKGKAFYPHVVYRYSVDRVQYVSDQLAFGSVGCGSRNQAARIVASFPQGSTAIAHYDSHAPEESVLIAGRILAETWVGIAIFSLMIAADLALVVFFLVRA